MFSGKNQASQAPTAFGSMLQAATYGLVIPSIYGRTQSPLYAIWAQNLRQGGSTKKFKQMKKGVTAYCENIDFLLGKNPILGPLQMWNNGALLPLNYVTYSTPITAGSSGVIAIPDSHFYSVIGVTLTVDYSETFNDYGAPGPSTLTGSMEVPLWNQYFAGPDPTGSSDPRNFPYRFRWQPGDGAVIHLDDLPYGSLPSGTLKIYYAQLSSVINHQTPASKLRLSFESILGSGDEYDGFGAEQILYPWYAGLGSQNIDLGAMGTIPAIKVESQGKWGFGPNGDCDFVDIIEDVIKSGIAQASIGGAINFGATEHGTGSYDLPGTIQKKLATSNNASGLPPMLYDMPNTQGNILVVSATGQGALSIASSNGETWTPVFGGTPGYQVWWATAVGGVNTVTVNGAGQPSEVCIMEVGGVGIADVALDSYTTVFPGDVTNASASITKNFLGAFGPYYCPANWNDFQMIQPLPSDAVVQGIYPVIVAAHHFEGCDMQLAYGANVHPEGCNNGPQFLGGGLFPAPGHVSFGLTEFYGDNRGTDLSVIAGEGVCAVLYGSLSSSFPPDLLTVTAVGYAVYYTSAHIPTTPPPIPPPFTVPVGQGVAWALPGTVNTSCNYDSGSFDYQWATATAAAWTPALVVTADTPLITATAGGGFSVDTSGTTARKGSVLSTVAPDWPSYLLAIPFYPGDSPASAQVAKWKALTPENMYAQALATFQAHGRIVRNPGSYSFNSPGSDPTALAMLSIKYNDAPQFARPSGDFLDAASVELTRAQCRAGGLVGSLAMISQQPASQWVSDLCDAADCAPVFSGHRLKLIPRSEVSAVGNGAVYLAPTASGPVADLDADNGDFVCGPGESPIKAVRKSRTDIDTVLQMQHLSRAANYQQVVTAEPDAAGIALYGVRKKDPITNNAVQDPAIARSILSIMVRRRGYVEPLTYSFTLNQRWAFLDPMDLVTITDRAQGIVKVPVRLTSWSENENLEIPCEAEPFIYGIHAPQALPVTALIPYSGGGAINESAGDVNPPIIMEPVSHLYSGTQKQLWLVISSPALNYGGAQVYVSTDGGASYNPLGDPVIGSAITGVLTADWPSASDPDTTNDLALDLTESNGVLESYAVSDEDNFVYPCYVAGQQLIVKMNGSVIALLANTKIKMNGTTIAASGDFGYELMTYANAVLTGAHLYTLKATGAGNKLRRAVFNAPDNAGLGIDHPAASRFAFLSPAGTGIMKVDNMNPVWVGQTLYFKILSFNEFGSALQGLSDVPAYAYAPTGVPSTV
jgi:hypothetical protein